MNEFIFTTAKGTSLEHNSQGYYLVSKAPIKTLWINKSLYSILQSLNEGISISEVIRQHREIKAGKLLQILLSLTYRGYYQLEKLPDLEVYPRVSVIIPVRNPSYDLTECLESIAALDYPHDKLEVLVVEDGPSNGQVKLPGNVTPATGKSEGETAPGIKAAGNNLTARIKFIKLKQRKGPGGARNAGVAQATGEILAFIDADCVADKNWLREIIPFFQVEGTGAVGGFVDSYYRKSNLDRYEEVASSLNLGSRVLFEGDTESVFYVPTCNMLVKRQAFFIVGGFKERMQVGEDVDFCWRMRNQGYALLYVPIGKVAHKHRNRLTKMLQRRFDYGSSEAVLYRSHPDKKKRFLIPVWAGLSYVALILAIFLGNAYPLSFVVLLLGIDLLQKSAALQRLNIDFSFLKVIFSALRSHFSFYYFTSFHLVRYYLILILGLGFLFHPIWYFAASIILLTSIVDFVVKKPHLLYPVFLFFYVLEHLAYQVGVFRGCLKLRYFGSYLPVFRRNLGSQTQSKEASIRT